ncbi:MAG: hypothetical protein AAFP90_12395 [Planctomycetota bacterium]
MSDYKISRCSRRCTIEDRALNPGERFYSGLFQNEHGELIRRDYAAQAITEPPPDALGWWKGEMPAEGAARRVLAPRGVLVQLLRDILDSQSAYESPYDQQPHDLDAQQAKSKLAFLLAILLMRMRVLKPVDEEPVAGHLLLDDGTKEGPLVVPEVALRNSEIDSLQSALHEMMYCDAILHDEDETTPELTTSENGTAEQE